MIIFASMKGVQSPGYGTSLLLVKNGISNVVASNSYSGSSPVISVNAFVDFDGENDYIEAYLSTSTGTQTVALEGFNTQIAGVVV